MRSASKAERALVAAHDDGEPEDRDREHVRLDREEAEEVRRPELWPAHERRVLVGHRRDPATGEPEACDVVDRAGAHAPLSLAAAASGSGARRGVVRRHPPGRVAGPLAAPNGVVVADVRREVGHAVPQPLRLALLRPCSARRAQPRRPPWRRVPRSPSVPQNLGVTCPPCPCPLLVESLTSEDGEPDRKFRSTCHERVIWRAGHRASAPRQHASTATRRGDLRRGGRRDADRDRREGERGGERAPAAAADRAACAGRARRRP